MLWVDRVRGACLIGRLLLALPCVAVAASDAEAAESANVVATGDCPAAGSVAAAIAVLLPGTNAGQVAPPVDVRVADLGARYLVRVGDAAERTYVDESRDCSERARVAAIFAALTLRPPQVAGDPDPPRPARRAMPGPRAFTELALAGDASPTARGQPLTGGADVRLGVGGALAIAAAFGVRSSVSLPLSNGSDARLTRLPMDAGLRLSRVWMKTDVSIDVGVAATWLIIDGASLPAGERNVRLDVGARAAILVGWRVAHSVTPFAGLAGTVSPRTYRLTLDGLGEAGSTPASWIGVMLGIRIDWSVGAFRDVASP